MDLEQTVHIGMSMKDARKQYWLKLCLRRSSTSYLPLLLYARRVLLLQVSHRVQASRTQKYSAKIVT